MLLLIQMISEPLSVILLMLPNKSSLFIPLLNLEASTSVQRSVLTSIRHKTGPIWRHYHRHHTSTSWTFGEMSGCVVGFCPLQQNVHWWTDSQGPCSFLLAWSTMSFLSDLLSRSIVACCVLPVLVYGSESCANLYSPFKIWVLPSWTGETHPQTTKAHLKQHPSIY